MRKALLLIASLWLSALAAAQTGVVQNHSFLGGKKAITSGTNSTNYLDGIIPGASITVYLHNTTTKATIYTVTGGPLANPFFSNAATAVDPGGYVFRANLNVGLDVVSSGGGGDAACTIQPNCYLHPVTLLVDVFPNSSISPIVNPLTIQTNEVGNTSQALLDFKDTATVQFTNPSGGIESATVPNATNSSKGVAQCDGTTTTCTAGVISANPALNVQTNEVNNASQTLLDFQNSDTVTFRNPSGGIVTADVSTTGSLTMQIVPPIDGQFVYVPATTHTIIDNGGTVDASNSSATMTIGTGAGFEIDDTVQWSNFTLPSYIIPGNITAVYGVVVASQTNFYGLNSLSVPGQPMTYYVSCGIGGGDSIVPAHIVDGWTAQQSSALTGITGANISTATCQAHIGANFSGGGNMIVSKIGLLVYYTGTAPPVDDRIIVVPPLTFNPDNNHLAEFVPSNVGVDFGVTNSFNVNVTGWNFQRGLVISMLAGHTTTIAAPSLIFNGNAARYILGPTGAALVAGDITTTVPAVLLWDGTNWLLQNPQVSGGGGGSSPTVGTAGQMQMVGSTPGSHAASACTDDGSTITCTEPINTVGPPFGISIDAGTPVAGATGTVVYASDATVGYAEVNENNTGLSRICTAANGICAGGGGSLDVNGTPVASPNLQDSATVTFGVSGSNIQATAIGGAGGYTNVTGSASQTTVALINTACGSGTFYATTALSIATGGTITCPVQFSKAGLWTIAAAQTVTFAKKITETDAPSQHFTGSGVAVLAATQADAYPEWWGAVNDWNGSTGTDNTSAIQAAITALPKGTVWLASGSCYKTTSALTITTDAVGIQGKQFGTTSVLYGLPLASVPSSCIISTSASADILYVHGTSGAHISWNVFKDFSLQRSVQPTGTAAGFNFQYTFGAVVDGTASADSIYNYYLKATSNAGGSGGFFRSMGTHNYSGVSYSGGGPYYDWYLDTTGGVTMNSVVLNWDAGASTGSITSTCVNMTGSFNVDENILNVNCYQHTYGIDFNTSSGGTTQDVHIDNPTLDSIGTTAIRITESTGVKAPITISGGDGWISTASTSVHGIDCESANNLIITGLQLFHAGQTAPANAIYANGCSGLTIANNSIYPNNPSNGIWFNNTNHSSITGNVVDGGGGTGYVFVASSNNTFQSNTVLNAQGTISVGASFDATSNTNKYKELNDLAIATTPVTDAGSGNGLPSDISGATSGQVLIAGSPSTATSSVALQGTDTKILTAGTIAGTGAALCTTANGGATTTGCAGGGGYPAAVTVTASSSAELDITTCITGSYRDYEFRFSDIIPATASQNVLFQVSTNGGSSYDTTNYTLGYSYVGLTDSTALTGAPNTSAPGIYIGGYGSTAGGPTSGIVYLFHPANSSAGKLGTFQYASVANPNSTAGMGGWTFTQSAAINAVRLISQSGNITSGTFTCQPLPQ